MTETALNDATSMRTEQVRVQLIDGTGEWFTPHQVPAALAAFRAIAQDIRECPGTYGDDDLRDFREALDEIRAAIGERLPAPRSA